MGSWNETCVLTRTPIVVGDDVMAWTTVSGPTYREPAGGGFKTALLFGLPYLAKYDDYGGVESPELAQVPEFLTRALGQSGLYREHQVKRSFGASNWWLASSPRTFWGLEHEMKHFFYDECNVHADSEDSYDDLAQARSTAAFRMCQAALVELGKAMAVTEFKTNESLLQAQLFELVSQHFGASRAWPVLHHLRRRGLTAHTGVLMMHRTAYATLVQDFSKKKVYYYGERSRESLRDHLARELDSYCEQMAALDVQAAKEAQDEDALVHYKRDSVGRKFRTLGPLTSPWQTPEAALTGHFWGGASCTDILQVWPREQVLDTLVFQWARGYLRLDLMPPSSGSQNEEVLAHQHMHQAVYQQFRKEGRLKSDFLGCLSR